MIKWCEPILKKLFPLTHPQKRIWYTEQMNPGTGLFHIGGFLRIKGEIDPIIMEQAFLKMFERNEGMRLRIVDDNGEPKQYLRSVEEFSLPYYDFSSDENPELKTFQWMEEKVKELFPEGENIYCALLKLADDDFMYFQKCHHIVSDGWTFSLLGKELDACYKLASGGDKGDDLSRPSYLEFIEDEKKYKISKRFQKNRDFWIENFQNIPEAVTLSPILKKSQSVQGKRYSLLLDEMTTDQLKNYIEQFGISVYSFYMTTLFTYMYRITGATDIIIGTPVLNRSARQKDMIGMFISTMPFRGYVDDKMTFAEFQKKILKDQSRYYRNQRYPIDLLVKDLELAKKGNNKLFEISLSYQNSSFKQAFGDAPVELGWVFNGCEENSLTIHINDRMEMGTLELDFDYATDAFDQEQIEQITRHFLNITKQVIKNPDQLLSEIDFMDKNEIEKIIYKWNDTKTDYPEDQCVYQLIEKQVKLTPDAIAAIFGERKLTYYELNSLANQLARKLREKGTMPDSLIGIMMERSLETLVGILGVHKAGGAYLPIDPDYPEERQKFMLEDAQCQILLTQSHLQSRIPEDYLHYGEVIDLDIFISHPEGDISNLEPLATPENLCYVIYTSGSTGKPKGVMVEHRGLMNYVWWAGNYYCSDCDANFPLYSSLSFDLTVTSTFVPLIKGGTIYVVENERGNLISEVMKISDLSVVKLTPAHLSLIKDENHSKSSIKKFILGGEELKADLSRVVIDSFDGKLEIHNEYGPTETVVGCIIHKFNPEEKYSSVLIGKPIQNTQIYILDKNLLPVAVGGVGEIYIAGDGVARGYLNRPELTAERFLSNPFIAGKRMYKSGDLGRYLSDGKIEYLGRVDTQVKIHGFRIEIGEIESALLKHPQIKNGVVDARTDESGSKYLAAYFVANEDLTVGDLRSHLLKSLPDYMVPTVFVNLEEIPLTSNGKVDRKALPEPLNNVETGVEYVAPETEKEVILAEIWGEVLGSEKVSIHDNFFELGGDSIKAIQVSNRLKNREINCQVQDIFTYKTISQLALHVTTEIEEIQAEQGILNGEIPFTPILKWFFDEKLENSDYWNQSILLKMSDVKLSVLQKSFEKLIEQHDALRLNLDDANGKMFYQNKYLEHDFDIPVFDLTSLTVEEQNQKLMEKSMELKSSFNVRGQLLIKAGLFELGRRGRRLLITVHHLCVDGISWRILLEDLVQNYLSLKETGTLTLPRKTTSFKEWAEALIEYSQFDDLKEEISYWEEHLNNAQMIPVDFVIDEEPRFGKIDDTETCKAYLSEEETNFLLSKANETYNTNVNDLLLTALSRTIVQWTGEERVFIQLEGHGREEHIYGNVAKLDLSRTVGWFTSIFPVEFDLTGRKDLSNQLKGVKEQLRKIPNKGIGYGVLKYLTKQPFQVDDQKDVGVLFNYLGQFDEDLANDLFSFAPEEIGLEIGFENHRTSLLEINSMVIEGKFKIEVHFSTRRFRKETIDEFLKNYVIALREILEHCKDSTNFTFTPSDFDTVDLSEDDLDQLFA
ncbi:MAG: amino acid adenylation domain-containing protein [Halanaerobiales bacterium]|nr:amino acid adenylation domain-containing protein [Halanaerobiales bacterium]